MDCYIGIDGGGSKTQAVLIDRAGNQLADITLGPSNPLRVGFDQTFLVLSAAVENVVSQAGVASKSVRGLCVGLAGAGRLRVVRRVMIHLVQLLPHADVHVTTDMEVALEAAAGMEPGVILISGTGSAAFGRNPGGHTARSGGLGPWLGDQGSAFDIGRRAVLAVGRARDHMGPVSVLSDTIPTALDCTSWDDLTDRIAQNPDDVFPKIFPLVVEAADEDDGPAREILFGAAIGLSRLAVSVIRRLGLAPSEFRLAKVGGVFGQSWILESALEAMISSAAPKATIELLRIPPALGAARMIQRMINGAGASVTAPLARGASG